MSDNKKQLAIADIEFDKLTGNEQHIVMTHRNQKLLAAFKKRLAVSIIVTVIVLVMEIVARILNSRQNTLPGAIAFILVAFAVYTLLSYGYMKLKQKIDLYTDELSCIYGNVCEKYDHVTLSKENRQKSADFILFDSANIHCTTAIPIRNKADFNMLTINTPILIIRSVTYGDASYEVYPVNNSNNL